MNQETILKYIEGTATTEEMNSVVKWIDASETNFQEYLSLRKIYEITLWNTPQSNNLKRDSFRFRGLLKIVAIFAFGAFFSYLFNTFYLSKTENQLLYTRNIKVPEGQRVNVELSDGSNVWVNANSVLTIVEDSNESREIFLEGEAHFDVAHDPNRKFIVKTNKYQMTVLGTEFNVKTISSKDYFEVGLVKGSLQVASLLTNETVLLKPTNKVSAMSGSKFQMGTIDEGEFAWINGILYLNDLTVREIFEKMELYYNVDIEVTNTSILEHKFTGKFWISDGVEQVLKVLKLSNDFEYKRTDYQGNIKIEIS